MTAGIEIEAKLSVADPDAIRALIERPRPELLAGFEAAGELRAAVVVDRYIDTVTGALERGMARARLRASRGETVLTFKRAGTVERGVTERVELEGPATADLAPMAWPDSPARRALLELVGEEGFVETARLRQHRTVRDLRRAAAIVELSLDHLEALDGDATVGSRWELEAELKRGARDDVADIAAALLRLDGVQPAEESKRSFARRSVAASRATAIAREPFDGTGSTRSGRT